MLTKVTCLLTLVFGREGSTGKKWSFQVDKWHVELYNYRHMLKIEYFLGCDPVKFKKVSVQQVFASRL